MMALTDGEREILAELAADASSWANDTVADCVDIEADLITEIYADLDALRDSQQRLEAHEAAQMVYIQSAESAQPLY